MHCFFCSINKGDLVLKEHEAAQWLTDATIDTVDWLPADLVLIPRIKEHMGW
jgi:8-oxo-dGTP diphosphatase